MSTFNNVITVSVRGRLILILAAMGAVALLVTAIPFLSTTSMINQLPTGNFDPNRDFAGYQQIADSLADQQSAVSRFALTGDERLLAPYTDAVAAEPALLQSLEAAAARDPRIGPTVTSLKSAVEAWRTGYAGPTISAAREGATASFDSTKAGDTAFAAVRQALADLQRAAASPPADLIEQVAALSEIRTAYFLAGLAALMVALLVSTRFVGRWVSRPLAQLVTTARSVESGEDVVFPAMRRDEIGDLAAALERMRRGMRAGQQTALATAEEANVLNRFTELAAFSESDSDLADAALTAMEQLIEPDDGAVQISNQSRDRATVEASRGDSPAETLGLGAIDACPGVRRGSLYVTPDVAAPLAVRCPVYRAPDGTVACIPLTALGETIGVVHLHWHGSDAVALGKRAALSRIAEHAALSIANRRLVNTLRGVVNTDARTGLVNSRGFDESVEAMLGDRLPESSEAILMLDIDHFKAFNDNYGHPAGDEALRAFARVVRGCLRKEDLPARYGGEEFAIHLKGMDRAAAVEVAERIRRRVDAALLHLGPGVTGRLTVSIGVAAAPVDGADRMSLLRSADSALYLAKSAGRNRVATTDGVVLAEPNERITVAASAESADRSLSLAALAGSGGA